MILSKSSISNAVQSRDLGIDPFKETHLKDASYTFTLSPKIKIPHKKDGVIIEAGLICDEIQINEDGIALQPGDFILGYTAEKLTLNGKFGCFLSARGSCAQAGLNLLLSSTFAEPDTDWPITIEIHNVSKSPILLAPGMSLIKGVFTRVE